MNVYDFDNTIYRGDSTAQFVGYCYLHRPLTLLSLPRTAICGLLYGLHLIPKLTFKQNLYHMFVFIHDMDTFADTYVETHMRHIKSWYYEQQNEDDVVISASPEFIIKRFCKKLGIENVMASVVDPATGKYTGINCHGKEKVRRFNELYSGRKIEEFYSDSRTDTPLAELAEQAFLVKGDVRKPWFD